MSFRHLLFASALSAAALVSTARAADSDVFALTAAPAGARLTAVADAAPMRVVLSLPLRDEAAARAYGEAVSTPGNPLYGHYLTPAEFGARFGADAANYEALRAWAAAAGLTVGPRLDSRAEISLGGTAGQFARLFATGFVSFPTPRGDGYTVTRTPTLPAELAGRVDGVIGLTSAARFGLLPHIVGRHATVGTGVNGTGYAPADLRTAYDVPAQKGSGTEVAAVFEQGGYPPSDMAVYEKAYKLPAVPITEIGINGSPTGVLNGVEVETDLDLQMIAAINPAINSILVYEDAQDSFQTSLVDGINLVAQQNKATVFSISYGQDEIMQGLSAIKAEGKALIQLQTQGITVFASSGDQGASGRSGSGLHAPDPGSQPLLTSVGGTALRTTKTQAYASEVVWNSSAGATGGGVSSVWKIPAWQLVKGVSVAKANGGSSTKRNVPDIAADADYPDTPVSEYTDGQWISQGGTSASSPIWAGFTSIYNGDRVAAGKKRLGFLNPLLYKLGEKGIGFHDVTSGNNIFGGTQGYKAGKGYDNTTGWGSIDVNKALAAFTK